MSGKTANHLSARWQLWKCSTVLYTIALCCSICCFVFTHWSFSLFFCCCWYSFLSFFLSFYNLQRSHLKVKYCMGYFHKFIKLHVSVKVQTVLMLVIYFFFFYILIFFLLFQPLWKLLTDMVSNENLLISAFIYILIMVSLWKVKCKTDLVDYPKVF